MLAPIPLGKSCVRVPKELQSRDSRRRQMEKEYTSTPITIVRRFFSIGQSEFKFPILNLSSCGWNGRAELLEKILDHCFNALD
jgi:hypothetical protein